MKLLHDGIRMFEDQDLPSSAMHPLRVPRDHPRCDSLPSLLLALHVKAYVALARASTACGHHAEARVILDKAARMMEPKVQAKRLSVDRLPVVMLKFRVQDELLKVLIAKVSETRDTNGRQ